MPAAHQHLLRSNPSAVRLTRPPRLPRWTWLLLALWGPAVLGTVGASGYRPPLSLPRLFLFGALLSGLAYLGAVALRRLRLGAAALREYPYAVRHGGLLMAASVGAWQLAAKVPPVLDAPPMQTLAAVLLHGTTLLPFALWGGTLWQAVMHRVFRIGQQPQDP